jgi:hypothetical protein
MSYFRSNKSIFSQFSSKNMIGVQKIQIPKVELIAQVYREKDKAV